MSQSLAYKAHYEQSSKSESVSTVLYIKVFCHLGKLMSSIVFVKLTNNFFRLLPNSADINM